MSELVETELWRRNGVLVRLKWETIPASETWESLILNVVRERLMERVGMVWDCGRPEDGEAWLSFEQGELEKWGYPEWGESMGLELCFDLDGLLQVRVKEVVHVIFGVEKESWLIPERYLEVLE